MIEAYKSGFEPPGDFEFEDYTQPMKRTVSDNSLSNSRGDGKAELKFGGKSKGKLWPFIKKNKVLMVGARCETSFIKCGDFDFIFQSQRDFKSVVSECKQKKGKKRKKKLACYCMLRQHFSLVAVPLPWPFV